MRMLDGVLNLEKRTVVKRRRQWIPFYAKSVEPNCRVPLCLTKGYQQLIAWDDTLHWILESLGVTVTRSRLVKLTNRHTSDWQNIPGERLASTAVLSSRHWQLTTTAHSPVLTVVRAGPEVLTTRWLRTIIILLLYIPYPTLNPTFWTAILPLEGVSNLRKSERNLN